MRYIGTFGSGWSSVIEDILKNDLNIEIIKLFDGLVEFKSSELNIKDYPFFNNVYLVLDEIKSYGNINKNLNKLLVSKEINFDNVLNHLNKMKKRSFKIKAFEENQPVKVAYNKLNPLENIIERKCGLKLDKHHNDIDFVIMQRSEGILYFLLKLSYNRLTEKNLNGGTLRPELCYLLIKLAKIQKSDIVLDPFCGSGAIPKMLVKKFDYNMCFASDIDTEKISTFKREFKGNKKRLYIKNLDALNMEVFEDNFIDAIITDPPWNIYNHENKDFTNFYQNMIHEFIRILKDNGRIIILMGNIKEFENALSENDNLKIKNKLSILVNGKKANVYYLEKEVIRYD